VTVVKDRDTQERAHPSAAGRPDGEREKPAPKNAKERLYDKLPLTVRQVDVIIKALIIILIVVLMVGIMTGNNGQ